VERLAIRGTELAVRQSGAGERDLVFVHGFQHDHAAWQPLVERLQDRYRCTAFDLAGCGSSGGVASGQRCSIDEYARDLVAVCDELGLAEPVVVGHSLGGGIAMRAALDEPERFGGLVLVAPASTSGFDFLPDEAAFQALAHPTPEQRLALARAAFRRPPGEDYVARLLEVVEAATDEHVEGAAVAMRDFSPELAPLATPALLVCGDRDKHVPLRNHLATHRAIPRCGLQVYFDVGHAPHAEVPDACAADVDHFLRGLK